MVNKRSDFMDVYTQQPAYKNTKQREAIAIKALEYLDKHYGILLGKTPMSSTAWRIVKTALENIRMVGNE